MTQTQPLLSNVVSITDHLRDPEGSLGQWALPPELQGHLAAVLTNANETLTNTTMVLTNTSALLTSANTNVAALVAQLDAPLLELSTIISNLNVQVTANTNFVTTLHDLLLHTDQLIQGFKRHWFLRSAFKEEATPKPARTNAPPRRHTSPRGATPW